MALETVLAIKTNMAGNIIEASLIDIQPKKSIQLPV